MTEYLKLNRKAQKVKKILKITFSILTTSQTTFDEFGIVKKEIYKEKEKKEKGKENK
jgi:hypothetical protein